MKIILVPQRRDDTLKVVKAGDVLTVNGEHFDFSPVGEGDTLPRGAIDSQWFAGDVERIDGELILTVLLPNPLNYSQEQAFPVPLHNVPDGRVFLPRPLPNENGEYPDDPQVGETTGSIDWSQLITQAMKEQAEAARALAEVVAENARLRAIADTAIAPLQDAVDIDDATEAEIVLLKNWKKYRVALNRLPDQPGYPVTIDWPVVPI
jgi:hypothetical protein